MQPEIHSNDGMIFLIVCYIQVVSVWEESQIMSNHWMKKERVTVL